MPRFLVSRPQDMPAQPGAGSVNKQSRAIVDRAGPVWPDGVEERLASRRADLAAFCGSAPLGAAIIDEDGVVVAADTDFWSICGLCGPEPTKPAPRLSPLPPASGPLDRHILQGELRIPGGHLLSVLAVFARPPERSGHLLCVVADATALRQRNAALAESEAQLRRAAQSRAVLLDVSAAILEEGRDDRSLAMLIFDRVGAHIGADFSLNYRAFPGSDVLRLVAAPGLAPAELPIVADLRLGESFCGIVAATRGPLAADAARIAADPRGIMQRSFGVRAYACHPLLGSDGALLGTLSFASRRRDRFDAEEIGFLQTLAHFLALAWQRRRGALALAEGEARMRAALEASGTGTFRWDIKTNALVWDDSLDRLFGLKPGQTAQSLGQFLAMVHPEDRAAVIRHCARCAEDGADFDMEFRVVRPDGSIRWLFDRGRTYLDEAGRPATMTGACVDVTDRKTAEARLARSEARFRAAVQAVSGIMWTNNEAGEMEGEQPGWGALTGQSFADYQGFGWSKAVHPDDAQPSIDAWNDAVAARKPFIFEHRVRRHDGVWRLFSIRAIPVLRADGTVHEWVGVHTDITEQREAETILARSRDELEQIVAERTRDLHETQVRLAHAQRMEALGQLAGGIAHDFNNVLQAVSGGASLIEKRVPERPDIARIAHMIGEAASRGASITQRLLSFGRRGDLRREPVDAATLLADMREVLLHTMGAGIGVRLELGENLPPLLADKGQLETVLVNLAANARDALDGKGEIVLSATLDHVQQDLVRQHFSLLKAGTYVRLSVADTGTGMPADILARATEPFFTTKGIGKGTGLGLAMARGFAEQSGGGLVIESEAGKFTVVSLWFPVADASTVLPADPSSGGGAGSGRPQARLLLVDDEPIVAEMLAEHLRMSGYGVHQAGSAPAALALIDGGVRFDLVVTDLSMPGTDGWELIHALRSRQPDLPIVLLTGFATRDVEQAVSADARLVLLRKPVSGERLAGRVADLLRA
jgi:PAS domain S-box-containing protein